MKPNTGSYTGGNSDQTQLPQRQTDEFMVDSNWRVAPIRAGLVSFAILVNWRWVVKNSLLCKVLLIPLRFDMWFFGELNEASPAKVIFDLISSFATGLSYLIPRSHNTTQQSQIHSAGGGAEFLLLLIRESHGWEPKHLKDVQHQRDF